MVRDTQKIIYCLFTVVAIATSSYATGLGDYVTNLPNGYRLVNTHSGCVWISPPPESLELGHYSNGVPAEIVAITIQGDLVVGETRYNQNEPRITAESGYFILDTKDHKVWTSLSQERFTELLLKYEIKSDTLKFIKPNRYVKWPLLYYFERSSIFIVCVLAIILRCKVKYSFLASLIAAFLITMLLSLLDMIYMQKLDGTWLVRFGVVFILYFIASLFVTLIYAIGSGVAARFAMMLRSHRRESLE